jgi:hypothetical protein
MKYLTAELTKATKAWVEDGWVWLRLEDEREIRFPITKNRRLRNATQKQLNNVELICDGTGIHWSDLDEDLSVTGILEGRLGLE